MIYKNYLRFVLPAAAGALLGYIYYFFIGCNSGSCAITSNPYISTLYGAAAGVLFIPKKKTNIKPEEK